jgi:hypothetical protein
MSELERYFRPEFLNRVDEVVVFPGRRRITADVVEEDGKKKLIFKAEADAPKPEEHPAAAAAEASGDTT